MKTLEVNLFTKKCETIEIDEKLIRNFWGGLGLGMKILYDEVGPDVDAMGPDNVLIVAAGLLSGTSAPTNGRAEIITKSPRTGSVGVGNFGGWWGPRLKRTGLEAVVIRGVSKQPVYLWINNGIAELKSAEYLWGGDTFKTTDILKKELGEDVSVLAIGQAGENLVKFACPVADYDHAPGGSAAGCVMGVKKLKAIVVRGTREVPVTNPKKLGEVTKEVVKRLNSYPDPDKGLRIPMLDLRDLKTAAEAGIVPYKHFQGGMLPQNSDIWRIPDVVIENSTLEGPQYGYHCPMAKHFGCNLRTNIRRGPYTGLIGFGGVSFSQPGYTFGGECGLTSLGAIWKCRETVNRYGIDEMNVIPFAMELYEKGILTKEDTGGLDLNWGNEYAVMELMGKIAYREGIGDILAEGSVAAAAKIGKGAEKYVLVVKGKELTSFIDPRVPIWGWTLGYVVSPRGDDLNTTHTFEDDLPFWAQSLGWGPEQYLNWCLDYVDMPEEMKKRIYGEPPNVKSVQMGNMDGRAERVTWFQKIHSIFDSLGLCLFSGGQWTSIGPTHYAGLVSACTGWEISPDEIIKAGDRIFHLLKAYAVREGFTRKDDDWPERFYKEPLPEGSLKGSLLSREQMDSIVDEYYELNGWDKNGIPTRRKLTELGLDYVADDLSQRGLRL